MPTKAHAFTNLGAENMEVDARDKGLVLGSTALKPAVLMNEKAWATPIFYQGQQPACGPHAGMFLKMVKTTEEGFIGSPRANWIDIKTFDGYPIASGTDMRSIFKSQENAGVLPLADMPNELVNKVSLEEYASAKVLTANLREKMPKRKIEGYGFEGVLTFDQLKNVIHKHGAVIALIRLGEEFWTAKNGKTSWKERDILPLRPPNVITSGHFIVLHSYDEKYIYFANSFSKDWGRNGHGYFGENYLPHINGIGTMVDDEDKLVEPTFTRDLYIDCEGGEDIRYLQQQLNAKGFTLAQSGAGSPGKESTYFGQRTQQAVVRWQRFAGVKPTSGYFGPISRAAWKRLYGER